MDDKRIKLKKILKNDLEKIQLFMYNEDDSFVEKLSDRVDIKEFSKKIIKYGNVYAFFNNNEIIAMIAYYMNDINYDKAYLTYICVNKKYRCLHLASKLLKIMVDDCIKNSFKKIVLETNIYNMSARKFYEKKGFKEINRNNNSVYYEKTLIIDEGVSDE